ncbi:hypothetical protein F5887DRAFT_1258993 [Amanita rubescens]|nr:hypothetical protein F5887DRAFT_1258993 [Amanita rubescens]
MDQDSFRLLLQTQKSGSSASLSGRTSKPKTIDASQPAFKPRKGGGNDYAEVEAVLDEFEKRNADNADKDDVERKRKYLGGDSEHSILVKGLDVALLEANKAKAVAVSNEDDDILEEAFAGTPISPPESNSVPRKRTREEIVRELKEKRGQTQTTGNNTTVKSAEGEAKVLEEAKKVGKFRPIGFKPIAEEKPKKKKVKGEVKDGERKKKKRKVDGEQSGAITGNVDSHAPLLPDASNPPELLIPQATVTVPMPPSLEPEPLPEEFDIFADVEEYEGLDLREEEEEDNAKQIAELGATVAGSSSSAIPRWVDMDEDEIEPPQNESSTSQPRLPLRKSGPPSPGRNTTSHLLEEGEMEEGREVDPFAAAREFSSTFH